MSVFPKSAPLDRATAGPLDSTELRHEVPLLDLGSLRVPAIDSISVKLEVEEATGKPIAVTLDTGDWSIQLQAFAAPRSEGVWLEVKDQLAASISSQGGVVEERIGSLGAELVAKLPVTNENGQQIGTRLARFVGVDGPRWFLRGVISGAALTDPKAAADADDLIRSVVVHRDETPMPPKDLLPIVIPGQSTFVPLV
ncbi:MAG: hypothetical protein RLZZ443_263 [Actinomycetota bacterium]|jgi:hypothetical protein